MSVNLQHLESVGSSLPLEVVVSMQGEGGGGGVMASVCWYLSASLRADTADICHLSISNLTALITIIPPLASPPLLLFSLDCNETHASHKAHSSFSCCTFSFLQKTLLFFWHHSGALGEYMVHTISTVCNEKNMLAVSLRILYDIPVVCVYVCVCCVIWIGGNGCVREHLQRDQPRGC